MSINNLNTLEEFDLERVLRMPHLLYSRDSILKSRNVAFLVLSKENNEILLINPAGFADPVVLAGLSISHIEYFSKNAPMEYRIELVKSFFIDYKIREIFEIAKAMDEDEGDGLTKNQERVENVIQYIQDNRVVFQF